MTDRSASQTTPPPAASADDPRNVTPQPVQPQVAAAATPDDAPAAEPTPSDVQVPLGAPRPMRPLAGAFVPEADTVTFRWAALTGATNYRLQVAADAQFEDLLFDAPTGPRRELTLQGLLPEGSPEAFVFWRVRAEAPAATPWSGAVPFHLSDAPAPTSLDVAPASTAGAAAAAAAPSDVPTPVEPAAGAPVDGSAATFTWRLADRARGYRVQVAADEAFDDLVFDVPVADTNQLTVHHYLPENGRTFFWRVRAERRRDDASAWSEAVAFDAASDEALEAYRLEQEARAEEATEAFDAEAAARAEAEAEAGSPVLTARTSGRFAFAFIYFMVLSFLATLFAIFQASGGI
jgi:hypothetical protein